MNHMLLMFAFGPTRETMNQPFLKCMPYTWFYLYLLSAVKKISAVRRILRFTTFRRIEIINLMQAFSCAYFLLANGLRVYPGIAAEVVERNTPDRGSPRGTPLKPAPLLPG